MRLAYILSIAILIVTSVTPRLSGGSAVGVISAAELPTDLAVDLGLDVEEEKAASGETDLDFAGRSGGHELPFISVIGRVDSAALATDVSMLVCRGPPASRHCL